MTGGPYLARFSLDVGFRCSFPLTLDSSDGPSGQTQWNPTSREKRARYGPPVIGEGIRSAPVEAGLLSCQRELRSTSIAAETLVMTSTDRQASLQEVAALLRSSNNYRWVGLYDI